MKYKVNTTFAYEFDKETHYCIPGDMLYLVYDNYHYKKFVTMMSPRNTVKIFSEYFGRVDKVEPGIVYNMIQTDYPILKDADIKPSNPQMVREDFKIPNSNVKHDGSQNYLELNKTKRDLTPVVENKETGDTNSTT